MIKVVVTREIDENDHPVDIPVRCDSYDVIDGILVFRNRLEPFPFLCLHYWIKAEVVEGRVNEENK